MRGLPLLVDDRTNGVTRMMLMNSPLLSSLFTICLVGFGGAVLGLLLSTLASSERAAVALLLLALLPQMLLRRVAFGNGGNPWSDPSPFCKIALLGDYLASDSRNPQGIALLAGSLPMLSRPGTAVLDLLAAPAGRSGSTGDLVIEGLYFGLVLLSYGLIAYLAFRWREAGAALGVVIAVDDAIRQAGLRPNRIARGSTLDPWRAPLANRERWHPRRNILVPIDSVADKSNAPTPKYVIITIKKKCIIERTPMPPGGRSQKKDEKLPHLAHLL